MRISKRRGCFIRNRLLSSRSSHVDRGTSWCLRGTTSPSPPNWSKKATSEKWVFIFLHVAYSEQSLGLLTNRLTQWLPSYHALSCIKVHLIIKVLELNRCWIWWANMIKIWFTLNIRCISLSLSQSHHVRDHHLVLAFFIMLGKW